MKLSRRSVILGGFGTLILVLLLALLVDWENVFTQIQHAIPFYLFVGVGLLLIGYITYAIRWHVLLLDKPHYRSTFHAANAGSMVNLLLPLRPGDATRIFMLGKTEPTALINVTTSIVVERWYEQALRVAALGGALVFGVGLEVSTFTVIGSIAYLLVVFWAMVLMVKQRAWVKAHIPRWLAILPRIDEDSASGWITTLIDGLMSMAKLHLQGKAFFWSLICWGLFWAYHYVILISLQPNLPVEEALGLSLGSLALVPPSATTLPGVYQVSLIVPLVLIGYDRSVLTPYAILLNMIEMVVVMALGMWGVVRTDVSVRQLLGITLLETARKDPGGTPAETEKLGD